MSEKHPEGYCEHCGTNHKQEIIDALPEIARFSKAEEIGREENAEHLFSRALYIWTHSLAYGNQNSFMAAQQMDGIEPHAAVTNYVEMMMRVSFIVGVRCSEFYREKIDIPPLDVDEEWLASYIADQTKQMNERSEDHASDRAGSILEAIRNSLNDLGMDSDIEVVEIANEDDGPAIFGVRKSKGDDETGMYL